MREKSNLNIGRIISIHPEFLRKYYGETDSLYSCKKPDVRSFSFPGTDINLDFPWHDEVEADSIALYCVCGSITYNSWWGFSTVDFMHELKVADDNPNFIAHLIYIDSPGGEAFGLNEAHEIIRNLRKPVYAVIDRYGCSAAYYIASAANKVYAISPVSLIGSIGCMATLYNDSGFYEEQGIKEIEIYATKSTLKNKTYNDALEGKIKEYAEKYLDPFMELFEQNVRLTRTNADDSVFTGDSYYSADAIRLGLIDSVIDLPSAINDLAKRAGYKEIANQLTLI